MLINIRSYALLFGLALAYCFSAAASDKSPLPKTMVKIVDSIVDSSSSSALNSWSAMPKTFWLAGPQYFRVDQPPDTVPRRQIQIITAPLDLWIINVLAKSGEHIAADPQDPNTVHTPVFADVLPELELGHEYEYFAKHNSRKQPGQPIHGQATDQYETSANGMQLVLVTGSGKEIPMAASATIPASNRHIQVDYKSYEILNFDPAVFRPSLGVKIVEKH